MGAIDVNRHIQWSADENWYYASVTASTHDGLLGALEVKVSRPLVIKLARLLREKLLRTAPESVNVGAWGNSSDPERFGRLCRYVAGREVERELAERARRDGVVIAPWFGQWTLATADAAYRMICAARAGDEDSLEQLERLREHAEGGDPAAQHALRMINAVAKLVANGQPAPSVVASRVPVLGALPLVRLPVVRPVTRPVVRPVSRPVSRPAARPVSRPATQPARTTTTVRTPATTTRTTTLAITPATASRFTTVKTPIASSTALAKPTTTFAAPTVLARQLTVSPYLATLAKPTVSLAVPVTPVTPLYPGQPGYPYMPGDPRYGTAYVPGTTVPSTTLYPGQAGYPYMPGDPRYGMPYTSGTPLAPYIPSMPQMPYGMPSGGGGGDLGPGEYIAEEEEDGGGGESLDEDDGTFEEEPAAAEEDFPEEPDVYAVGEFPEELEQSLPKDEDEGPGGGELGVFPGEGMIA